jgi:O-antigen/teichoic acid export membrane protein
MPSAAGARFEEPGDDSRFGAARRAEVFRSALVQQLPTVVSVACGLALVPFVVRRIGMDAYGLWVFALAAPNLLTCAEGALYWSCQLRAGRSDDADRPGALNGLGLLFASLGLAGFAILAGAGLLVIHSGRYLPEQRDAVPVAFAWIGVSFFFERLVLLGTAALAGMRRFVLSNTIAVGIVLTRTLAVFLLLGRSANLETLTACYAAFSLLGALFFLRPLLGSGLISVSAGLRWRSLPGEAGFTASSVVTNLAELGIMHGPSIVIGLLGAPAMTALLNLGQRPPLVVSGLLWKAAEPLFPEATRAEGDAHVGEILDFGTRWLAVLGFPFCAALLILAPDILRVWLGEARADAVGVLRLYSLGIMVDCLGLAGLHVTLGRGRGWVAARRAIVQAAVTVIGTALAIPFFGAAGAAAVFLLGTAIFAASMLSSAARQSGTTLASISWRVFRTTGLPLASLVAVLSAFEFLRVGAAVRVLLGGSLASLAYCLVFYLRGQAEDRRMLRFVFSRG